MRTGADPGRAQGTGPERWKRDQAQVAPEAWFAHEEAGVRANEGTGVRHDRLMEVCAQAQITPDALLAALHSTGDAPGETEILIRAVAVLDRRKLRELAFEERLTSREVARAVRRANKRDPEMIAWVNSLASRPKTPSERGCFRAQARVALAGKKHEAAGQIKVGQTIRSPDGETRVSAIYHDRRERVWMAINASEPFISADHPMVTQRGLVECRELRTGDQLWREDGGVERVRRTERSAGTHPSVNIETEGNEAFFVEGMMVGSYKLLPEE